MTAINSIERTMGDGVNVIEFTDVVDSAGTTFDLPGKYNEFRIQNLGNQTLIVTIPPYIRYQIKAGSTRTFERTNMGKVVIRAEYGRSQGVWVSATRYGALNYRLDPPPAAVFGYPDLSITVYTDGNGHYGTPFDVVTLATTGKRYFVDGTNGSDSNNGTSAGTALKTIKAACDKEDVVEILVLQGVYDRAGAFVNAAVTKAGQLNIKNFPGHEVRILNCSAQTWTAHDAVNFPFVYRSTVASGSQVFDDLYHDERDDMLEYTPVTSIAACNALPGSCYINGTTTYINTIDGRVPDTWIKAMKDQLSAQFIDGTFYFEGISFEGGNTGACGIKKVTTAPKAYFKNCKFKYSVNEAGSPGGLTIQGASEVIVQNCECARNLNDGFNYHVLLSTITNAIEINCIGRDNGKSGDIDNGSTMHDGGKMFRLNGIYPRNKGSNVGDIGVGTQSWTIGCAAGSSTASAAEKRYNANFTAHDGATVILEGCESLGGSLNDYTVQDGAIMMLRGFHSANKSRTFEGTGKVINY